MWIVVMLLGLGCFAFAVWIVPSIASDIQIIVVEVAAIGGFVLFGIAMILLELRDRR